MSSLIYLEMEVARLGVISEVDPLAGVSDDVLGARVLAVTSPHQSLAWKQLERARSAGNIETEKQYCGI